MSDLGQEMSPALRPPSSAQTSIIFWRCSKSHSSLAVQCSFSISAPPSGPTPLRLGTASMDSVIFAYWLLNHRDHLLPCSSGILRTTGSREWSRARQLALGDGSASSATLRFDPVIPGGSLLGGVPSAGTVYEEVALSSIDAEIENEVFDVLAIKMDVEGSEVPVLLGATKALGSSPRLSSLLKTLSTRESWTTCKTLAGSSIRSSAHTTAFGACRRRTTRPKGILA